MTMNYRKLILWAVVLVGLLFVNYSIYGKEALIASGDPLYLELGPRDPRSLIQGDFMALRYRLVEDIETAEWPRRGQLVLQRDADGVGTFVRLHDGTAPLAENELLIGYHQSGRGVSIGAESFFFQEGTAELYENALYGELRVDPSGGSVLVGLRDEGLKALGPSEWSRE